MKYLILFLTIYFLSYSNLNALKICKCGSHASGITQFYVDDGQPCCGGAYSGNGAMAGSLRTYNMGIDGVWYQTSLTFFDNSLAQTDCCG